MRARYHVGPRERATAGFLALVLWAIPVVASHGPDATAPTGVWSGDSPPTSGLARVSTVATTTVLVALALGVLCLGWLVGADEEPRPPCP
jgi:hypothetical protein